MSRATTTNNSRDWMFCPLSGYLLEVQPAQGVAVCRASGFSRNLADLSKVKLMQQSDMKDFRRKYNLEPLVKDAAQGDEGGAHKGRTRATVDEPCPKCGHGQMEYYTMQLRSADEGQTVFYDCAKCSYKYSVNN